MKKLILILAATAFMACNNKPSEENNIEKEATDSVATETPAPEEPSLVEQTGPVLGIDVSHFQGKIDWQKIKDANIKYAYDKATQGMTYVDPEYKKNRMDAHSFDFTHGAYHFYVAGDDPQKQALHFVSVADYTPDDLPPVLDLEQGGMKASVKTENYQKDVLKWLQVVEEKLGVKPVIYTSPAFGNQYLDHPSFGEYDLWVAEYGVDTPKVPNAWKEKEWLFWQRSERGTVEGAVGQVDHDIYNPKARPINIKK